MKRGLSCGALPVRKLLNHRGHRGNTEGELIGKHKKHKRDQRSQFQLCAFLRIFVAEFLPFSVSSVVNLKLKN